jgi:1-acyl-sn-glycerol-3-phosphate acyltransferase
MIMKFFSRILLKIWGWKIDPNKPRVKKCVMIAAPHTSNWDFILGFLYSRSIGSKINFMVKKELFFFPLGVILKWMGGIPVDRQSSNRMVEQIVNIFKRRDFIHLTITPEGTRKKVSDWKKGFYYIARRAKVPIYVGYLDYRKKEIGFITEFVPTDNVDSDIRRIKSFYLNITPRHPERFTAND